MAHVAGEDGANIKVLSETGRKYSVQVRTNTMFHPKVDEKQQREAKTHITWPRQWKGNILVAAF